MKNKLVESNKGSNKNIIDVKVEIKDFHLTIKITTILSIAISVASIVLLIRYLS